MTELYIDGQPAVLPEGFGMTFTSENPYFTRSSSYSLDVELPMPDNHAIFGHINRLDVTRKKTILPASLIVDGHTLLYGSAVILSMEDSIVKVQLVSGNAEFNLLTNDDIYIDELDLGTVNWPESNPDKIFWPHSKMDLYYASVDKLDAVWLPVIYQEIGNEKPRNEVFYHYYSDGFALNTSQANYCVQPYLLVVIRKIMDYFGYVLDENFFEGNFIRNIYICSAVNSNRIADALPHWTISEFIDELEKFFCAITVVDNTNKKVRFVRLNDYFSDTDTISISDSSLLREFTVDIENESDDKDISTSNISFNLPSTQFNKYWRLDKEIAERAYKVEYPTYEAMVTAYNAMNNKDKKSALFIVGKRNYINFNDNVKDRLLEVNFYADLIRDAESDNEVVLKIVPADIFQVTLGMFSSVYNGMVGIREAPLQMNVPIVGYKRDSEEMERFDIQAAIDGNGENFTSQSKNERMEVAFNTGIYNRQTPQSGAKANEFAYPFTDYLQKPDRQLTEFEPYSLSLQDVCPESLGHQLASIRVYHSNIPYTIRFKADRLPDVNKVFQIGYKRYLCEKIEAEIDADGLNRVLKGTFYRVE